MLQGYITLYISSIVLIMNYFLDVVIVELRSGCETIVLRLSVCLCICVSVCMCSIYGQTRVFRYIPFITCVCSAH